jgi:hypothetical protein
MKKFIFIFASPIREVNLSLSISHCKLCRIQSDQKFLTGERKLRRGASRDTTYRMIGVDMILIEGGAERQELDGVVDGSVDTESVAVWRRPERWSQLRCRDQWRPSQL